MTKKLLATFVPLFLLVHQIPGSASSKCYYDNHGKKLASAENRHDCSKTLEFTENCGDFRGQYSPFDPETNKENFEITADVWRRQPYKLNKETVLNVTISNTSLRKLTVRLEDIGDPPTKDPYCQLIEFKGDDQSHLLILYILTWHRTRTKIQFVGYGKDNTNFFREFHFIAPSAITLDNGNKIDKNHIFAYIDSTYTDRARLYVQPLPKRYKILYYAGEFRQYIDFKHTRVLKTFNLTKEPLVYNVAKSYHSCSAAFDFLLTPVDEDGKNHSSTEAARFIMSRTPFELFLMIFGSLIILITLFIVLRQGFISYRNWVRRGLKTSLLLTYSPSHPLHIDVVEQFGVYLRNCNFNVMLDKWGIVERHDQNPGLWCDESFTKAEVVVVVTSPPDSYYTGNDRPIYNTFERIEILITENRSRGDERKRYVTVLLPYCAPEHIPAVAKRFRRFNFLKQLKDFLDTCHNTNYTDLYDEWKDRQKLLETIECGIDGIRPPNPHQPTRDQTGYEELNKVLFPKVVTVPKSKTHLYDEQGYRLEPRKPDNLIYQTRLEELNLEGRKTKKKVWKVETATPKVDHPQTVDC